jgi:1,4-alpha-glucan branching enzyme
VILDWVPSIFSDDAHGLNFFDGSEHPDRRKEYHPDWKKFGIMDAMKFVLF